MKYLETGQKLIYLWIANIMIQPSKRMISVVQTFPEDSSISEAKHQYMTACR